ncbi:MAG: hypothetical protein FJX44_01560 [Alphaproteobacteria bacterium]|nr:hypothetical protein [Alphaproteobacteria bacterium]
MSADTRLKLGLALLVVGLIMPFGTVLVLQTDWPDWVKNSVSGLLIFGFEILMFPAVALMGKENFDRIVSRVKGVVLAGKVSRTRYTIGLVLLIGAIAYAWLGTYVPELMPSDPSARLWANLALDLVLVASLFVLGGEFWDKLRALFLYDARAVLPNRK